MSPAQSHGASERRGRGFGRHGEAETVIGYGVLRVSSIHGIPGEPSVIEQIFAIRQTIAAYAARRREPRNTNTIATRKRIDTVAKLYHGPDDLMPGNDRRPNGRPLAVNNTEVRPADTASIDFQEKLPCCGAWSIHAHVFEGS